MASRAAQDLARETFRCKPISWFPGHMMAGLREMRDRMRAVDLVVEARDARIPLSSINRQFEQVVRGKPRLVVYNKADLAPASIQETVRRAVAQRSQRVLFTDTSANRSVRKIIDVAREIAASDVVKYPRLVVMVVGMPNVGKSSLINALRRAGINRGKAAPTGAKPGVTRAVSSHIRVFDDPPIYLVDTPGVMIPHIPDPITAIKVALTGGIKDNIADQGVLAEYLLFRLNRLDGAEYWRVLGIDGPTDDVGELLDRVGRRIGALQRGGEPDADKATQYFLRAFREGRFGPVCLDALDAQAVEAHLRGSPMKDLPLNKRARAK